MPKTLRFDLKAICAILLLNGMLGCSGGASPAVVEGGCPAQAWTVLETVRFGQPTLSVMFRDASFGIAADLDGGIHYTEDAGQTWTYAATSGLSRVALEMNAGLIWHVGYGGAVTRSADDGRTWEFVSSLPHSGHIEYMTFADEADGWALSTELDFIFVSRDGARTWESLPLPDGTVRPAAIHLRTARAGYLLDTAGSLFVTEDGGVTWSMLSLPLADGEVVATLNHSAALRFTDAQQGFVALSVLAGGSGRTLGLRTDDGGRTWSEEPLPVPLGMFHLTRDAIYLTHVDLVEQDKITVMCSRP